MTTGPGPPRNPGTERGAERERREAPTSPTAHRTGELRARPLVVPGVGALTTTPETTNRETYERVSFVKHEGVTAAPTRSSARAV